MERIILSFFPEILCELCSVQTTVSGAGQGDDGRTSCIQSFLTIGPQMVTGCDKKGKCPRGAVQWSSGRNRDSFLGQPLPTPWGGALEDRKDPQRSRGWGVGARKGV